MTPYELFDISLALGNRIDVQWGLFLSVHLALLGGIVFADRSLRRPEKIGAAVIYLAFALLNFRILRLQMNLLKATFSEIAALSTDSCCVSSALVQTVAADVASGRFMYAETVLVGGHLLMALIILLSIAFDRAIKEASD